MSAHRPSRPSDAQSPARLALMRRVPLWLGSSLLPLLAISVVWTAFADFLSWRHTQLLAGAVGGLLLLLLRLLPTNARGTSAGRTPMAVTMFAIISAALLGLMSGHPQLWDGAMIVLMLAGVTAWLWYPPEGFMPFRAAAQASIALNGAILIPLYLEKFGYSPWHAALRSDAVHAVLRGTLDHSQTLSSALFLSSMCLVVAAWPSPDVPRRTQRLAQAMLLLTCGTVLLWVSPIPLSARVALAVAVFIGVFWRPHLRHAHRARERRYRWGAFFAVLGVLVAFTLPPLASPLSPYAPASDAQKVEQTAMSSTAWRIIDPVPAHIDNNLRQAEWRAAFGNLPFGAGAGTSAAETIRRLHSSADTGVYDSTSSPFGWANTPRSTIATLTIEHGVITLFVWILMTAGGLLLARLVIIHSNFPSAIAQVIGVIPGVAVALLPGASQMASALAMVLSWFLLCAPLAQAEARMAARLVPAASTPLDERRAPRGRILLLLIPGVFIAWFAIVNARWSKAAHHGYVALQAGDSTEALRAFARANHLRASATTYTQEALLLEQLTTDQAQRISARYNDAMRLQPRSAMVRVAHAQWILRQHAEAAARAGHGENPAAQLRVVGLDDAMADLRVAQKFAPHWDLVPPLLFETLTLLDQRDEADVIYAQAMANISSSEQRDALRLLRIRALAWKHGDRHAARSLLLEAQRSATSDTARHALREEALRLDAWENTGVSPYTDAVFHLGHVH